MARHPRASSYEKVRRDHAVETAEDYVEAISDILHAEGECRVKDLASHMGVSHVTVTRIVSRLRSEQRPQGLDPHRQQMLHRQPVLQHR